LTKSLLALLTKSEKATHGVSELNDLGEEE